MRAKKIRNFFCILLMVFLFTNDQVFSTITCPIGMIGSAYSNLNSCYTSCNNQPVTSTTDCVYSKCDYGCCCCADTGHRGTPTPPSSMTTPVYVSDQTGVYYCQYPGLILISFYYSPRLLIFVPLYFLFLP